MNNVAIILIKLYFNGKYLGIICLYLIQSIYNWRKIKYRIKQIILMILIILVILVILIIQVIIQQIMKHHLIYNPGYNKKAINNPSNKN
jgi:hypothetical protein